MSTATAREHKPMRWSSMRTCPRKAVYEAVNAPARQRSDKEERILFRGRELGWSYAKMLAARHNTEPVKYGDPGWETAPIVCELPVRWPLGVGHMDVFVRETGSPVEVLSSAHASEAMVHSKLLQVVGYREHCELASGPAALVILNPSDFTEETIVLSPDAPQYAELVEEMRARIEQVIAWRDGGDLPSRVCAKPSQARSHFCLHEGHCFTGWEPPDVAANDDPEVRDLVARLWEAKQQEGYIRGELKSAEAERKAVQEMLCDRLDYGEHLVGPVVVKRAQTVRKDTFDWERAQMAGVFDPEPVAAFFKPGARFDTVRLDKVGDEPLEDYGEVPF